MNERNGEVDVIQVVVIAVQKVQVARASSSLFNWIVFVNNFPTYIERIVLYSSFSILGSKKVAVVQKNQRRDEQGRH